MKTILELELSSQFKRDLKKAKKQRKALVKLDEIIELLQYQKTLPKKNRDHALTGDWKTYHECHIEPDWLLIYKIENQLELLRLMRLGSHSELF